jgi:hypothetical protein
VLAPTLLRFSTNNEGSKIGFVENSFNPTKKIAGKHFLEERQLPGYHLNSPDALLSMP